MQKLLLAVLVTSPSPQAFFVMCQYPSLMCSLVSVMARSYTVISQKGQLKHQGYFLNSSPVTNILGQINSHLYFLQRAPPSLWSPKLQSRFAMLQGLSSVEGAFRGCEHLDRIKIVGLLHRLMLFMSIYVNCCTGGKLPILLSSNLYE